MVASSEPMYDSLKLKLVCVSSGAPRLFDAVQDGVTDPWQMDGVTEPRFSAEHLIGSSCNRKKANEIFHNLSSCDTRSINEIVSGAILHKLQLVQPMIYDYIHYYSVYTAKPTLASQVLLNSCAQTLNIWDPEYQKIYFYRRVKSYPYGI